MPCDVSDNQKGAVQNKARPQAERRRVHYFIIILATRQVPLEYLEKNPKIKCCHAKNNV